MRAKEFVTEKKKRKKRKVKYGVYGPGLYGWYGFNPGYSGEYDSGDSGGGDGGGGVEEGWSAKYKRSINCSNPKGFSQRAHCQGRKKTEDVEQDPGDPIPFPAGTTMVDVSDPYDWYKLGMVISDLDDANPKAFGRGGPSTVLAFGSEEEEHRLLPHLKRLGLGLKDIDRPQDVRKALPAKAVLDKFEESQFTKRTEYAS